MFDTKRNPHVLRGRKEQEELAKRKQESVMDLELDLLAPYLERYPDVNSLSKAQVNRIVVKDNFPMVRLVLPMLERIVPRNNFEDPNDVCLTPQNHPSYDHAARGW